MTIEQIREKGLIIFECISGSHAYGLETEGSDVDIKGVFVLPAEQFFGMNYIGQVSDNNNDIVFYELKKFAELLLKSNPTVLEMLYTPSECIRYIHPVFNEFLKVNWLSKRCKDSFGGYAKEQINKAKGLKKKMLTPVEKDKKGILDFCYVTVNNGSMLLLDYLNEHGASQQTCGVARIPHIADLYALYFGEMDYEGIIKKENSNDIHFSKIRKGELPKAYLYFNKQAYSNYCKSYKQYWEWVTHRSERRYKANMAHGMNYDSKNMMHTIRLLRMCAEIAEQQTINVKRNDRQELLDIKRGLRTYEELLKYAHGTFKFIEEVYASSHLPDDLDNDLVNSVLRLVRNNFYNNIYNL